MNRPGTVLSGVIVDLSSDGMGENPDVMGVLLGITSGRDNFLRDTRARISRLGPYETIAMYLQAKVAGDAAQQSVNHWCWNAVDWSV